MELSSSIFLIILALIITVVSLISLFLTIRFLWHVPNVLLRIANTLDDIADLYYKQNKNQTNNQENRQ